MEIVTHREETALSDDAGCIDGDGRNTEKPDSKKYNFNKRKAKFSYDNRKKQLSEKG